MTTEVVPVEAEVRDRARSQALLKAIGLDRVTPEQREITIQIAKRYDLDLLLRHVVLVDGKPYITRDGLLHVAHRSGMLDGIEVSDPELVDKHWHAKASVYRKDMSRPFTYAGRYPAAGKNTAFAPEMAVKVAEVMALRRAFDVSAPALEERWDVETTTGPAEPARPLAERVAERAAAITNPTTTGEEEAPVSAGARTATPAATQGSAEAGIVPQDNSEPAPPERCGAVPPEGGLDMTAPCEKPPGHGALHRSREGTWSDDPVPVTKP